MSNEGTPAERGQELIRELAKSRERFNLLYALRLIDEGADLSQANEQGDTALIWAAYQGYALVVKNLLAHGAPLDPRDHNYRRTALEWARQESRPEVIALLEERYQMELTQDVWKLFDGAIIAHIRCSAATGFRLTDIFNFQNRERYILVENIGSKSSSITPVQSFDDLPRDVLDRAFQAFKERGGVADESAVFRLRKPGLKGNSFDA